MTDGQKLQDVATSNGSASQGLHFKDAILDSFSAVQNIAQFASFGPDLEPRFSRLRGFEANQKFASLQSTIDTLLELSSDRSVNVRSFHPELPKSGEFVYGLHNTDEVVNIMRSLSEQGLYTIINETIDVEDGGVSGVALGNLIEFAPEDTPRCVEKPGVASLERKVGLVILETIYGFPPALDFSPNQRVEFSIHPIRQGLRKEHTIIWEVEEVQDTSISPSMVWPNRFSKFVGDKVYGLLVAYAMGLPVPLTTVIGRYIPPYQFGESTNTGETWIRTSPGEAQPGYFTTKPHWVDPFKLLQLEDPDGTEIASVLAQEGVDAMYSGALIATESGDPIIEGVQGTGMEFMIGDIPPEPLPPSTLSSVNELYSAVTNRIGPVRMEWVYDGTRTWVIQMHTGHSVGSNRIIVPGNPTSFCRFSVADGIDKLRELINEISSKSQSVGIILEGDVGVTSHLGDILRKSGIPSQIDRP